MSLGVGNGVGARRGARSRTNGRIPLVIVVGHEYQKSILCLQGGSLGAGRRVAGHMDKSA